MSSVAERIQEEVTEIAEVLARQQDKPVREVCRLHMASSSDGSTAPARSLSLRRSPEREFPSYRVDSLWRRD